MDIPIMHAYHKTRKFLMTGNNPPTVLVGIC
jgi:hypothetical protein